MKLFSVALFFSVIFLAIGTSFAFAQITTVDLSKIDPEVAAQVLREIQKTREPEKPLVTASEAKEWAEVGAQIASGIAATAKGLSLEANEFIKTPVGKLTFFLIAWHFFGAQLWSIVGGIIIWVVLSTIILWSFRKFHLPRTVE